MSRIKWFLKTLAYGFGLILLLGALFTALMSWRTNPWPVVILFLIVFIYIVFKIYEGYSVSRETVVPPDGAHNRPPAVLVCPHCDSGIYQHRANHALDCPNCEFTAEPDYITDYDIVRFDCPQCGANIENRWATRDLVGDGPPNTLTHVNCDPCGWGWKLPHD
jgi:DNA-directed RNA polymerase subunit M/transcription elongation factor TFIIS